MVWARMARLIPVVVPWPASVVIMRRSVPIVHRHRTRFRPQRPIGKWVSRMPAVAIEERVSICMSSLLMRELEGRSVHVLLMLGEALLWSGVVADAAGAAAEGDVVVALGKSSFHAVAILEGFVDEAAVHVHDGGVVVEAVTAPLASGKADSAVAEAVVYAAVIADVPSPVALMEEEAAMFPTPVAGGPKQARRRRGHPCARNPIVAGLVLIEGPVAGSPHQAGFRARRLLIDRQRRRSNANADGDLRV